MAILIKNDSALQKMREVNKIVALCHEEIKKYTKAGITTKELDQIAEDFIRSKGAEPNFLNYGGFPGSACISVNEVIIHGVPTDRKLKDGDIVSFDLGAVLNGFHGDAARTHAVGKIDSEAQRLMDITEKSFFEGLKYAKAGNRLVEMQGAIEDCIEGANFGVLRDFCGHGIGKSLHESPEIPNYRTGRKGPKLEKGMTLAVEPMVTMGSPDYYILDDEWTVVTADGKYAAHYENTFAITDGEPEILTML